jgi:hypothetical protein
VWDWVIGYWGRKNIMGARTLHQELQKFLMAQNNFLYLINPKKHFLKK